MARETFSGTLERFKDPDTNIETLIRQHPSFERAATLMLAGNYDYEEVADLLSEVYEQIAREGLYIIQPDDIAEAIRGVFQRAGREAELDRKLRQYHEDDAEEIEALRSLYANS